MAFVDMVNKLEEVVAQTKKEKRKIATSPLTWKRHRLGTIEQDLVKARKWLGG